MRERVKLDSALVSLIDHPFTSGTGGGGSALDLLERGYPALQNRRLPMRLLLRGPLLVAHLQRAGDGRARGGFLIGSSIKGRLGTPASIDELLSLLLGVAERELELGCAAFHQLDMRKPARKRLARLVKLAAILLVFAVGGPAGALQGIELAFDIAARVGVFPTLPLELVDLLLHAGKLSGNLVELQLRRGAFSLGSSALCPVGFHRDADVRLVVLGGPALLVQQQHRAVETLDGAARALILLRKVSGLARLLVDALLQFLGKRLGGRDRLMLHLQIGDELLLAIAGGLPAFAQLPQVVDGQRKRNLGKLAGKLLVTTCALGLPLKRAELARDLAGDIPHAIERGIHVRQLALGARLALLVLQNAGGLLDERPAILGFRLQDGIERALADDGVRP